MSTALAAHIATLIRDEGPIGLDRYMALALGHPQHGYYVTRDPLGAAGDFTTAPEISQMFGELVGLWCAAVHASIGAPPRIALVELGPGRGTLMADLLRATRIVPAFRAAITVHLVETSPVLRVRQAATLAGSGTQPHWHDTVDTLPDGPLLLVANEFFDALPVRHFVRGPTGWHERLVGLGTGDALTFGLAPEPDRSLTLAAPLGAILELGLAAQATMGALARRIARDGGAVLTIDYGYATPRFGESLQALRRHAPSDPLASPGEADLTTHVDFSALAGAARRAGAVASGPVTQGAWLHAMGIAARAATLSRARPEKSDAIEAAMTRLTAPAPGMGELFKALAITAAGAPRPPGFPGPEDRPIPPGAPCPDPSIQQGPP